MKNRRYKKVPMTFKMKHKRILISLTSIILIVATTVAVTLAYRTATTQEIENNFEVPEIETPIEEDFDGNVKTNVTATNSIDSDVDVYVRLKFVIQTLAWEDENNDGLYDSGESGAIVATPDSFDSDGYLLNLPINIINLLEIEGLNVDFSGSGYGDWFTDAAEETGIYFYKYSLAPGESAYDLVTSIVQEVLYEDIVIRLTVLVDSVQVYGVEDAWVNVNQSEDYVDANGNPILESATYVSGTTGVPAKYDRVAATTYEDAIDTTDTTVDTTDGVNYVQRFGASTIYDEILGEETLPEGLVDNYDTTQSINSYGNALSFDVAVDTTE